MRTAATEKHRQECLSVDLKGTPHPRFADPLPRGEGVETRCHLTRKAPDSPRSLFVELLFDSALSRRERVARSAG